MDNNVVAVEDPQFVVSHPLGEFLNPEASINYSTRQDILAVCTPPFAESGDYLHEILLQGAKADEKFPFPQEIALAGVKLLHERIEAVDNYRGLTNAQRAQSAYEYLLLGESLFLYAPTVQDKRYKFSQQTIDECNLAYIQAIYAYAKYVPPLYADFLYKHGLAVSDVLYGELNPNANTEYAFKVYEACIAASAEQGRIKEVLEMIKNLYTASNAKDGSLKGVSKVFGSYKPFLRSVKANIENGRLSGRFSTSVAILIGLSTVEWHPLEVYKMADYLLLARPNLSARANNSIVALAKTALSKMKLDFEINTPYFQDKLFWVSLIEEEKRFFIV